MLGTQAEQVVDGLARSGAARAALLRRILQFTSAQRIARAALNGTLGPDFPRGRVLQLLRDAQEAQRLERMPTPVWNNTRSEVVANLPSLAGSFGTMRDTLVHQLGRVLSAPAEASERPRIARCIASLRVAKVTSFDGESTAKLCGIDAGYLEGLIDTANAYRFDAALIATQAGLSFKDGARCERHAA